MAKRVNMLFVDDDESLIRLLTRVIGDRFDRRLALTSMTDPVAAKRWIEQYRPDLVLTDLEMPEVDGFEILACARKRNPYSQVVVHSGQFSPDLLRKAIELGASDYVPKRTDRANLLEALESACCRVLRWSQVLPEIAVSRPPPVRGIA